MISTSVVPNRNVVFVPLEPHMCLLSCGDELVEIPHDSVTLGFRYAHDLRDEAGIEEDRLSACYRIDSDQWVLCGDWFATDRSASGARARCLLVC